MKIPVVLPVVRVKVDESGTVSIDIDGEAYESEKPLFRKDLQTVLDTIATEQETAVRVEIRESDGTTYADIATPPEDPPPPPPDRKPVPQSLPGISGTGFQPGEPIAVAYVLLRGTADAEGQAALHLPPSVLAGRTAGMVLMGLDSKVASLVEASA